MVYLNSTKNLFTEKGDKAERYKYGTFEQLKINDEKTKERTYRRS